MLILKMLFASTYSYVSAYCVYRTYLDGCSAFDGKIIIIKWVDLQPRTSKTEILIFGCVLGLILIRFYENLI